MSNREYVKPEFSKYDPPESARSVGWTAAKSMRLATEEKPFNLEFGGSVGSVDVEYETYGALNPKKDNVVLIAHALSGDAHVAGWDSEAESTGRAWRLKKPGWWDAMVGPGKPIDTNKFFVLCANVLGGCYGSTGPSSTNPATGDPYGLCFPMVTIGDWVQLQARLLDELGIDKIHAAIGGSIGGQQVLEWALAYPERVERCIVLAASAKLSTQGLAFNAVGRHSIMNDPHFNAGNYYRGDAPSAGLAAARMLAHITYLSDESMGEKFGRKTHNESCPGCGFGIEFEVERYLDHQGRVFVERFDANSYLYITRAMDYYDAARWGGDLVSAVSRTRSRFMIVSFDSDWLYPPEETRQLALALLRAGKPATYVNVPSLYGHDAFLVETAPVGFLLKNFLNGNDSKLNLWLEHETTDSIQSDQKNGFKPFKFYTPPQLRSTITVTSDEAENESAEKASEQAAKPQKQLRWQDRVILDEIPGGVSVLDLGCGDGELLLALARRHDIRECRPGEPPSAAPLAHRCDIRGQGIELDPKEVFNCVSRGVPVFQGDIDTQLHSFEDKSFDYVVLEETLQTVRRPVDVLREMLRIGRYGIVSFPNFANYRLLYGLFARGKMPVDNTLPHEWYETPNIHLFTIRDFLDWAAKERVRVLRGYVLVEGFVRELRPNDDMFAEEALLVVESIANPECDFCI